MTRKLLLLVFLMLMLSSAAFAQTDKRHGWPTMSLMAGGYSLGSGSEFDADASWAVKVGYVIKGKSLANRLGIEAVYQKILAEQKSTEVEHDVDMLRLDLLYLLNSPKWAKKLIPFISVGGGMFWYDSKDLGDIETDRDPVLVYGVGAKYMFTDYLGVRVDLRQNHVFSDEARDDFDYSIGLTYRFGVKRKPKVKEDRTDTDGDGVLDSVDKCSDTPASLSVDRRGCPVDAPDNDSDGVPDYLDRCKNTPKDLAVDQRGCFFDDDGDGVPNERDRCPSNPPGFDVDEKGCTLLK